MTFTWYDAAGTAGVACIVITYLLLQLGRLQAEQFSYSLLNAVGAGLVLLSLVFEFNFSAFMVEAFWLLISLYGMVRRTPLGSKRPVGGD